MPCLFVHKLLSFAITRFFKKKISTFYGDTQFNLSKASIYKKRLKLIKEYYGFKFLKNKKILDVGGGINPILSGKNIFIADFKIQKKIKVLFKNNFYKIDINDKTINDKFDCIFLMHTLEHFKYPAKAINNIFKSLKSRGRLFIEIPNFHYYTKKNTYCGIFHQHLSMFTIKHLRNLLNLCGLKIEKIFLKDKVIFCSAKKNNVITKKVDYIDNRLILNKFKIKLISIKKKISNHIKNKKFNIYGAGGSMALAIATICKTKQNINQIFDQDSLKCNKIFPGTKRKILKNIKKIRTLNFFSLSAYNINKNNNLNIHKI